MISTFAEVQRNKYMKLYILRLMIVIPVVVIMLG